MGRSMLKRHALTLSLALSCQSEPPRESKPASLYGAAELDLVNRSHRNPVEESLGSLQMILWSEGVRFATPVCTAIRISRKHLLTANHCVKGSLIFNPEYYAARTQSETGNETMDGVLMLQTFGSVVRLIYDGQIDSKSTEYQDKAPTLATPLFQEAELDFAIYEVPEFGPDPDKGTETDKTQFVDLSEAVEPAVGPTSVTQLLGYPNGSPLTRSQCHQVLERSDLGLAHDCDALSGSSGGLMVQDGRATAMHLSGPAVNDGAYYLEHGSFESPEVFARRRGCPDAGKDLETQCVTNKGYNRALPLSKVKATVTAKAPALWLAIQENRQKNLEKIR